MSQPWTDRRVELIIGNLLRTGVGLAATVVMVGAAVYLAGHGRSPANYTSFQGEPAGLSTIGGILRAAVALNGPGIIQLGLLLLIATPVARVAFAVIGFAREGDLAVRGGNHHRARDPPLQHLRIVVGPPPAFRPVPIAAARPGETPRSRPGPG